MNNDLEQFSEERLIKLSGEGSYYAPTWDERKALARIALAAKQAKPVAQVYQPANIGICAALGPAIRMINVGLPAGTLLYTTPQSAHTEHDGCQWNPDEDSVYSTGCGNEWQFTEGGLEDNKITFCPYCSGKIATPKPESE
ncbi:MAG: hypothetical protein GYA32_14945 [Serratia sp.]|nr:hypothetical protein [Serratia sp. (in: enterobacteria)]